jgi:hypothetical protein
MRPIWAPCRQTTNLAEKNSKISSVADEQTTAESSVVRVAVESTEVILFWKFFLRFGKTDQFRMRKPLRKLSGLLTRTMKLCCVTSRDTD